MTVAPTLPAERMETGTKRTVIYRTIHIGEKELDIATKEVVEEELDETSEDITFYTH